MNIFYQHSFFMIIRLKVVVPFGFGNRIASPLNYFYSSSLLVVLFTKLPVMGVSQESVLIASDLFP